ncbi:hypothetical protein JCM3766R1_005642 [Sporobolomyces carnicolor]
MDDLPLPLDVVYYLIERILPCHLSPIPLTRTLLSLSLVSRSFNAIAQPVLYRAPYISFDPPDTTTRSGGRPGQHHGRTTLSRIENLVETLHRRADLRAHVETLDRLGQWSVRALTDHAPRQSSSSSSHVRKLVSGTMVDLVRIANPTLVTLSFPFILARDKDEFLDVVATARNLTEITFGDGGVFERSIDPWIIHLDPRVSDEWSVAKFTVEDFKRLERRRVKRFRLSAKIAVRDPLEEHDPLTTPLSNHDDLDDNSDDLDDEERFLFRLEEFELNLFGNSKISFAYLDRLLRSSRATLTRLVVKEHQFESRRALEQFLSAFGRHLATLTTESSDPVSDNVGTVATIARACPNLRELKVGSSVRGPLAHVFEALARGRLVDKLESLHLSHCYSLALFPAATTTTTTTIDASRQQCEVVVDDFATLLFRFERLRTVTVGPQHDSVEHAYEQERHVATYVRDLDQRVGSSSSSSRRRTIESSVSYWRWRIEISDS